ncbi:Jas TPL-binding domain, partial [Sesbania bispinosa]
MEKKLVDPDLDLTIRSLLDRGQGGRGHKQGRHGSGEGNTRWSKQGTQNHPSQKREASKKQNSEDNTLGTSSIIMEKDISSPQRQFTSMEMCSPSPPHSPERVRSWEIPESKTRIEKGKGRITMGGILCDCCQRKFSVWEFEEHVGSDLGQPYKCIYLHERHMSLHNLLIIALQDASELKRKRFPKVIGYVHIAYANIVGLVKRVKNSSRASNVIRSIYEKLEGSLGVKNDMISDYSWRVIRKMDMTFDAKSQDIENNSKVAVAWMLMNEAFETIIDKYTGINVLQSIVYSCGSNLTRINFSRFYTFVMEKDDEIICAATIRLHGRGIAEMPFIATDNEYRGQGICQLLMREIES